MTGDDPTAIAREFREYLNTRHTGEAEACESRVPIDPEAGLRRVVRQQATEIADVKARVAALERRLDNRRATSV